MRLFCDCKTDEEKSNFFLSGRAVETGVIAPAISNEIAMAYHRCAQLKKENDTLRAKIAEMERQEPVAWLHDDGRFVWRETAPHEINYADCKMAFYALPGAQPAPSVPEGFSREDLEAVADGLDGYEKTVNVGNVTGEGDDHLESTTAYAARFIRTMLAAAPEPKS